MSDDEYDEEDCLVMVELYGIIDPDFLRSCSDKCKLLGVESEKPILQLGHYIFEGQYEDTLGTCVIFEEEEGENDNDEIVSDGEEAGKILNKSLSFFDITSKKLNMTRIFLNEKTDQQREDDVD